MNDEPGFHPDEIERGEDQASHMPLWGCVAIGFVLVAIVGFLAWAWYQPAPCKDGKKRLDMPVTIVDAKTRTVSQSVASVCL